VFDAAQHLRGGHLRFSIFLGAKELLGEKSKISDVTETVKTLNRRSVFAVTARVLNAVAYDLLRGFRDDQIPIHEWLPEEAQRRLKGIPREKDADYKIFHPFQLLVLLHLAARWAEPNESGLDLSSREGIERWAVACLQINDHISKSILTAHQTSRREGLEGTRGGP
jgi:hypothetical protein